MVANSLSTKKGNLKLLSYTRTNKNIHELQKEAETNEVNMQSLECDV